MPPSPEDQLPGAEKRSPLGLPPRVADSDPEKTEMIWTIVQQSVHKSHNPIRPSFLGDISHKTAILPFYWNKFPPDFTKYLRKEMFDTTMTNILEHYGLMNWHPNAVHLHPLSATGDGNCLLHAISLALWGVEDTDLLLRKVLHHVMIGEYAAENESRWRYDRNKYDTMHIPGSGFRYNTKEWTAEWQIVVDISSPERRMDQVCGLPYACLEEFHIYMMANVLRRPIIVLAEDMWRDASGKSLQPMNFAGVYLPLAWESKDCYKYPLVLGYHQMHFSPLVCTAPDPGQVVQDDFVIPLASRSLEPLPVHFLMEDEERMKNHLLKEYLFTVQDEDELFVKLASEPASKEFDVFEAYLQLAEMRFRVYEEEQHNPENAEILKAAGIMSARNTLQLNERIQHGSEQPGEPAQDRHSPVDMSRNVWEIEDASEMVHPERPRLPPQEEDLYGAHPRTFPGKSSPVLQRELQQLRIGSSVPRPASYPMQADLPCKTKGCLYRRATPTDDFCAKCYKSKSAVGKESYQKCLTDTCFNGGERDYKGLCKVCYDQSKFMNGGELTVAQVSQPTEPPVSPTVSELSARGPVKPDIDAFQVSDGGAGLTLEAENSNAYNLSTNVINDLKVGSKKCLTPMCQFTGNPKFSGLCSKCYSAPTAALQKSPTDLSAYAYVTADSPPFEIPTHVGKTKCIMPDCHLTGRPDKGDLCSGCYSKQTSLLETSKLTNPKRKVKAGGSRRDDDANQALVPVSPQTKTVEIQRELFEKFGKPTKCLGEQCEMFGNPQTKGYCSQCFKRMSGNRSTRTQSPKRVDKLEDSFVHVEREPRGTFQPVLQFTVPKNMCAMPGCSGVRIKFGEGDLCISHYQERQSRYSPRIRTSTPPGSEGKSSLPSGARTRPTAPPPSINPASIPRQAASARAIPNDVKICTHPSCSNLAASPHFLACDECLDFVRRINESVRERPRAEHKREPRPPSGDQLIGEMTERWSMDDEPAYNLRNFDMGEKVSPVIKEKFESGIAPRQKCRAYNGCPDDLFGDARFGGMCSKCFDREVVNKHHKTAPMTKAAQQVKSKPRSQSEIVSHKHTKSAFQTARPSNFVKCATPRCENQANPKALEGYCNSCYPIYTNIKKTKTPDPPLYQHPTPSSRTPRKSKHEGTAQQLYQTEIGSTVPRCKKSGCRNFGNSHSRGYCNECFLLFTQK